MENDLILLNAKHVYVLRTIDGSVKIGVSGDITTRMKNIQTASGKKIIDFYYTEKCSNSCEIESIIKKEFSHCKIFGEWFGCDYNDMKKRVIELYDDIAKFNYITEEENKAEQQKIIDSVKVALGYDEYDIKYHTYNIFDATISLLSLWSVISEYFQDEENKGNIDRTIAYLFKKVYVYKDLFYEEDFRKLESTIDNHQDIKKLLYDGIKHSEELN